MFDRNIKEWFANYGMGSYLFDLINWYNTVSKPNIQYKGDYNKIQIISYLYFGIACASDAMEWSLKAIVAGSMIRNHLTIAWRKPRSAQNSSPWSISAGLAFASFFIDLAIYKSGKSVNRFLPFASIVSGTLSKSWCNNWPRK